MQLNLATDQTSCYDESGVEIACAGSGQDAEFKTNHRIPAERFQVMTDVVLDSLTELTWCRNANPAEFPLDWQAAHDFINEMNGVRAFGRSGWRLPLRGWLGYFRLIETPTIIRNLDSWIRRRLRCYVMKQWIKNSHTRYQRLRSLGVSAQGAGGIAASRKGPWALSNAKPLKVALSNRFFVEKGLFFLLDHYELSVTTT